MAEWPTWRVKDFSAGMIDSLDDALLPDNASRDCRNFISRYKGIMEKRPGQARFNGTELSDVPHGMYSYYNGATRKLLVMAGTVLSVWNPSTLVFDDLKTTLSGTAVMEFETCANYMVAFNGVDAPFKWTGSGATTALSNAPATGKYPTLFKEKLFCVPGTDTSQLWWSDSFAPETWPAVNYWDIKKGDGDEITCLRAFYGDLVIFKNRSLHLLRGTSLDDFRLDEMDDRVGCVGNQAAVAYENNLYFVSTDGIYIFNGLSARSLSEGRIPRLWKDIDQANIGKAQVSAWEGWLWFSLPLKHVMTFKVTAGCTTAGEITITLGGEAKTVTLTTDDNLVAEVATKIAALKFEGWTLSVVTDTVTFTRNELRQPLTLELAAASTGVTATIATTAQTTNNLVMLVNPEQNNHAIFPTQGINSNGFIIWNDGTGIKFLSGDTAGKYVNQQFVGTEDFSSAVSAYFVGKAFDVDSPERLKKAYHAYIIDYPNQITPATLKISYDYGDFIEWSCTTYDGLQQGYLVPPEHTTTYWRYLTPRLSHTAVGRCEVRGIRIPFKPTGPARGRNRA